MRPLRILTLLALLTVVAGGCQDDSPGDPVVAPPEPMHDFALTDVNPTSPTVNQSVSPRDYLQKVSAWYFGHATRDSCISQFGRLDAMQKDLDALLLPVEVSILGVNGAGHERGNATVCEGRDIPWLQETPEAAVWSAWRVTYQDVVILDGDNKPMQVYNLAEFALDLEANYEELKTLLIAAAGGGTVPDFALTDVNPTSETFDQAVSPRDYLQRVSAWYFGHAT